MNDDLTMHLLLSEAFLQLLYLVGCVISASGLTEMVLVVCCSHASGWQVLIEVLSWDLLRESAWTAKSRSHNQGPFNFCSVAPIGISYMCNIIQFSIVHSLSSATTVPVLHVHTLPREETRAAVVAKMAEPPYFLVFWMAVTGHVAAVCGFSYNQMPSPNGVIR